MHLFSDIQPAPADPILGLTEAFKKDARPHKINLSVGIYQDEAGASPLLASVKEAERRIWEASQSKSYLPIQGDGAYLEAIQELIFGTGSSLMGSGRIASVHTPGGTGALRLAGDFIRENLGEVTVWVSNPTWVNHQGIFNASGLATDTYAYFSKSLNGIDWDAFVQSLKSIPEKDVVLLHGCCHNPTGADPTAEQWQKIASIAKERNLLPIIDFAYQGFAEGLAEDTVAVQAFAAVDHEFIICNSFSKNFGLYKERVGAISIVSANAEQSGVVLSQLKRSVRTNYSNPPAHGGHIVSTILKDPELTLQWKGELDGMRNRIKEMRNALVSGLIAEKVPGDFSFINRQNGMFSFSGLSESAVEKLRADFGIYIVKSGRINVAGLNRGNIKTVCEAIAEVLRA